MEQKYWERFMKSGKVSDYLQYRVQWEEQSCGGYEDRTKPGKWEREKPGEQG